MEKYSVIKCVNNNFIIASEHSDLQSAIVSYHGECRALWNSLDVETATVIIVDSKLRNVNGYYEPIKHEQSVE